MVIGVIQIMDGVAMNGDYIYDNEIKETRVMCAQCAFARQGLIYWIGPHLDLWTYYSSIDGLNTSAVRYLYNKNIDYEYEVQPYFTNPNLLLPSKERAIVEYIKCERWCDEGTLIEGLKTYLDQFCDMEHLYEVAEFFKLDKPILDYWIKEALEDEEI
jgi:hypothetical protein